MPRPPKPVPAYRLHKPTGQAVVTVRTPDGRRKDIYLGRHGTAESIAEYNRIVTELAAAPAPGAAPPSVTDAPTDLTVDEILLPFIQHAETHYRHPDGRPTSEQHVIRMSVRPLRELYGTTRAREFGPRALLRVRGRMVQLGWSRPTPSW